METCTPDVQSGATPPQPPYQIEAVALDDGTVVAVRPVAPDDAARIDAFVDALSEESAHRRFLGAKRRLTRKEIRYLTEVDHRDHEALVALDRGTGALLGVARYIRAADRPDTGSSPSSSATRGRVAGSAAPWSPASRIAHARTAFGAAGRSSSRRTPGRSACSTRSAIATRAETATSSRSTSSSRRDSRRDCAL